MKKVIAVILTTLFLVTFSCETTYIIKKQEVEATKEEKQAFFDMISPYAVKAMEETGLYASIIIAQSAIESSWGSDSNKELNSFFGVKASSEYCSASEVGTVKYYSSDRPAIWDGKAVCRKTWEENKQTGQKETVYAYFKAYDSLQNSINDRNWKFFCQKAYKPYAIYEKTTLQGQLDALGASPYATDSSYTATIADIINQNNLQKYDAGVTFNGKLPDYINCDTNPVKPFEVEKPENPDDPLEYEEVPYPEGYEYYYIQTLYTGDITQGYIYKKHNDKPIWTEMQESDDDEEKVIQVMGNIFKQGEKLYGDDKLHLDESIFRGTQMMAPNFAIIAATGLLPAEAGNFANWKQFNYPNTPLGSSNQTIKSAGCLVTSVAIQMARAGVNTAYGKSFDPRVFVEHLNANGGFTGANFYWDSPSNTGFAKDFKYTGKETVTGDLGAELGKKMAEGYYPVLRVKYGSEQHWVAVYGASSGSVSIYDPAKSSNNLYESYPDHGSWTVSYYKVGG